MNVLEVKNKDFIQNTPELDIKYLRQHMFALVFNQDFVYYVFQDGGIFILKNRYDDRHGVFFSE